MATDACGLGRNYARPVRKLVHRLVTEFGIRIRHQDSNHFLLYPVKEGDRTTFRVAAHRDPNVTLRTLRHWAEDQVGWRE